MAVRIDTYGLYLEDIPNYEGEQTDTIILVPVPSNRGFYHPRWNGSAWLEGLSEAEISARSGLPQTLEEAIMYKQQQIIELAAAKQSALVSNYADAERDTWDRKETEAAALLESNDLTKAKYLKAEAVASTGATTESEILMTTKALAQRVLYVADQLRTHSAHISGTRARKWNEVQALTDLDAVLNYPVEEGWS